MSDIKVAKYDMFVDKMIRVIGIIYFSYKHLDVFLSHFVIVISITVYATF